MCVRFVAIDQYDRIDLVTYSEPLTQFTANIGLHRRELKDLSRVISDYKVDGTVAEVAFSVE